MDKFEAARLAGLAHLQQRTGIGTLSERSLHAVLKYWADPEETHHEVSVGIGRLVADIFDGERVTEIQTRSFQALRPKLDRILPVYPMTVIYPIAHTKKLIWVDPATGESSRPRKSPKTGSVWDAFPEIYRIRRYLPDPHLTIRLLLLDMEEYKLLNGWSRDRKKGASRFERIPTALCGVVDLNRPQDYAALLPSGLPDPFTTGDFRKLLHITGRKAGYIINVLYNIGSIKRTAKVRNAYVYKNAWETYPIDGRGEAADAAEKKMKQDV